MNHSSPSNESDFNLSDADERALDALLGEALHATPAPPDLSQAILTEWSRTHQRSSQSNGAKSIVTRTSGADHEFSLEPSRSVVRKTSVVPRRGGRRVVATLAWIGALAASVLVIATLIQRSSESSSEPRLAETSPRSPSPVSPAVSTKVVAAERPQTDKSLNASSAPIATPKKPLEGVPLVHSADKLKTTAQPTVESVDESQMVAEVRASLNHAESLSRFNTSMLDYWARVGVKPAAPIDDQAIVRRVNERFGTGFSDDVQFAQGQEPSWSRNDSQALASRLTDLLFRGLPISSAEKTEMVADGAQVIANGSGFDEWIAASLSKVAARAKDRPDRFAEAVATNLLDVDAGCARCHDSPLDGQYSQHDYWSFASIFSAPNTNNLFYELKDGRQKVAERRLPERWLGLSSSESIQVGDANPDAVTKLMIDNRRLASVLVNRLWEIAFDAPLVARSSVIIAPPRDEALLSAHHELTNAMLGTNFDIRAIVRLIAASDAMRRGIAEPFQADRLMTASEESLRQGAIAERTFAATSTHRPQLRRDELLATMEQRLGRTPRAIGDVESLLAQPSVRDEAASVKDDMPVKLDTGDYAWSTWIADRQLLRDSWLHWIEDDKERYRHAFYASGQSPPDSIDPLVERLTGDDQGAGDTVKDVTDRLAWLLLEGK